MKYGILSISILVMIGLSMATISAHSKADTKKEAKSKNTKTTKAPVYKPPLLGAPKLRLGGGARGAGKDPMPRLCVVAPADHVGLTTKSQPVVLWFITKYPEGGATFSIRITDPASRKIIHESKLSNADSAGWHTTDLSSVGVKLPLNKQFIWSIVMMPKDLKNYDKLIASTTILRVEANEKLKGELTLADRSAWSSVYAENGIWYEAMSEITLLKNENPDEPDFAEQKEALIKQVGLSWTLN